MLVSYLSTRESLSGTWDPPIQFGICLGVCILRRFEERSTALETLAGNLELRTKAELKCLIEFTRWILSRPLIAEPLYLHYDFNGVRRPIITTLLSCSMKVFVCLDRNKTEEEGFKKYLKSFVSSSIFNYRSSDSSEVQPAEETLMALRPLFEFLDELSHIKSTVNQHPKKVYKQATAIYEKYHSKEEWLPRFISYLHHCPMLEGAKLTETIGAEFEDSQEMLDYFCSHIDFRGISIVEALRKFFRAYHMTAEGAKIERVLGQFISEYAKQNPVRDRLIKDHNYGDFDTQFYAFVFSLIVLNTDYHKKADQSKMTFEKYKSMVHGIYRGTVLSEEDILSL